jgi:predicted transposase/invertase (TIGR01784 family)
MKPNIIEVVPLRYDVAFKKAFGQVDVFNAFVRDVLNIEFEVDEVSQEYSYHEQIGRVKLKYDLFAEDKERRIIVEIQHAYEADFFDRFLYYHLIGMIEQVHNFRDYRFQKTVYTIVFLTSLPKDTQSLFGTLNVSFQAIDEFQHEHPLFPHRLIFLNPNLLNEKIAPNLRIWLEAVQDSLDTSVDLNAYKQYPTLQRAFLSVQKQAFTPEEFTKLKDEAAWELAKHQSHQEGREVGREEGRELGLEEGELRKAREIARKMLAQNIPHDTIAALTGLSLNDINTLAPPSPTSAKTPPSRKKKS